MATRKRPALPPPPEDVVLESVERLSKQEIHRYVATLSDDAVRGLVELYYQQQEIRKASVNQAWADVDNDATRAHEINGILLWASHSTTTLETQIKRVMAARADLTRPGRWCLQVHGIGPVLTSGLLAHWMYFPNPSHLWSYAGLNPDRQWLGDAKARALVAQHLPERGRITDEILARIAIDAGRRVTWLHDTALKLGQGVINRKSIIHALSRRPWNLKLKVLCWKVGESFVIQSKTPRDTMYGALYRERKLQEVERNERGLYAEQAEEALRTRNIKKKELADVYRSGKLPDGRLDLRARRVAVKMFLAHLWEVTWRCEHPGEEPPLPPIVVNDKTGQHKYVPPPLWPID